MDSPLSSLDHWTYPLPLPFAAHHPHSHQSDSSTSSASPQPSPFSFTTTSSSSSSLSGDDGYEEGKGGDGGVFGLLPRASLDPLLADDAAKGLGMGEGSSTPTLTPEVDAREEDVLPLTPPENFSTVAPLLYRSSFPSHQNFPFLKSLGLKTVLFVPLFFSLSLFCLSWRVRGTGRWCRKIIRRLIENFWGGRGLGEFIFFAWAWAKEWKAERSRE